jgi:hypothetical protein
MERQETATTEFAEGTGITFACRRLGTSDGKPLRECRMRNRALPSIMGVYAVALLMRAAGLGS